jgi:hypothetical protein
VIATRAVAPAATSTRPSGSADAVWPMRATLSSRLPTSRQWPDRIFRPSGAPGSLSPAAHDQHPAVGEEGRGVLPSAARPSAGGGPRLRGRVVDLGRRCISSHHQHAAVGEQGGGSREMDPRGVRRWRASCPWRDRRVATAIGRRTRPLGRSAAWAPGSRGSVPEDVGGAVPGPADRTPRCPPRARRERGGRRPKPPRWGSIPPITTTRPSGSTVALCRVRGWARGSGGRPGIEGGVVQVGAVLPRCREDRPHCQGVDPARQPGRGRRGAARPDISADR